MVSFCSLKTSLPNTCTVLIFFIAGLLLCLEHVFHWERIASRWRAAFSSHLIRERSVVQVHPGPPFKSPINTRRFSLFPFSGLSLKKPFCQPFVNFTIGRMALHSGVKTLRAKAERLASIRRCRECCPSRRGHARQGKILQGFGRTGKSFLVILRT